MASEQGVIAGIGIDLAQVDWAQAFAGLFDPKVISDAMYETLDEMEAIIEEHFADKEPGWKALAAGTIAQRLLQGYEAGPILTRSGTLKENVARNKQVTIQGTEVFGSVSPSQATVPEGRVPITEYAAALDAVRPFYDLSDEEQDRLFDILEEKIAQKLGFI
jgi:hypothetical protein